MTAPHHTPAAPSGGRPRLFTPEFRNTLRESWATQKQRGRWIGRQVARPFKWAWRNKTPLAIGAAAAKPAVAAKVIGVTATAVGGSPILAGIVGFLLGKRERKRPPRGTWSGPVVKPKSAAENSPAAQHEQAVGHHEAEGHGSHH